MSIKAVAAEMSMAPNTLSRKLDAAGLSHDPWHW
jgi:hypothetical protein